MTDEKWIVLQQDPNLVARIQQEHLLPEAVARLLCNRGLTEPEQIRKFLKNDLKTNLHDPFLLADMDKAVARVEQAIANRERITVYGDYDVDGITSTVILYQYLSERTEHLDYYIPSRMEEGYGLNAAALEAIRARGTTLLITVDTGTTAVEEIAHAKEIGLDVVVTDHHECMEALPDCPVVNPKRKDSAYPFPELAGVGVVFKFISACMKDSMEAFRRFGGITAIGTIADIMPILDENRSIVRYGLENLQQNCPPGIRALLRLSGSADGGIDTNVIAYQIAPRMNAAGRIGDCKISVQLLLETDPQKAEELAQNLCAFNVERKEKEQQVVRDIDLILAGHAPKNKIMVYASDRWHNGVIGIAASRLTERYARPCILICFDGDSAKGSARSVRGVNLFELVGQSSRYLENFGGHEMAVGLTLKRENYEQFLRDVTENADRSISEDDLIPTCEAEFEVDQTAFSPDFVRELGILEPFGNGNPYPSVVATGLKVLAVTGVGGGKHTRLTLEKNGVEFTAMWFGKPPEEAEYGEGDSVDIFCTITEKIFRQKASLNVTIRSIRFSEDQDDPIYQNHYHAYRNEGVSLPEDCRINRNTMVALYRYLTATALHNGKESTVFRRPETIIRAVNNRHHANLNYCRLMLCLDTMQELELLRYTKDKFLSITLFQTEKKVDLCKAHDWDKISSAEKG
ncbi:MAG: single-stranded-DNA-specific exonuclease RecJ [Clostridia bacterium]|nr:single-stranded-DNA-specific exonuclease RecJ [Clostridia bacterium]